MLVFLVRDFRLGYSDEKGPQGYLDKALALEVDDEPENAARNNVRKTIRAAFQVIKCHTLPPPVVPMVPETMEKMDKDPESVVTEKFLETCGPALADIIASTPYVSMKGGDGTSVLLNGVGLIKFLVTSVGMLNNPKCAIVIPDLYSATTEAMVDAALEKAMQTYFEVMSELCPSDSFPVDATAVVSSHQTAHEASMKPLLSLTVLDDVRKVAIEEHAEAVMSRLHVAQEDNTAASKCSCESLLESFQANISRRFSALDSISDAEAAAEEELVALEAGMVGPWKREALQRASDWKVECFRKKALQLRMSELELQTL